VDGLSPLSPPAVVTEKSVKTQQKQQLSIYLSTVTTVTTVFISAQHISKTVSYRRQKVVTVPPPPETPVNTGFCALAPSPPESGASFRAPQTATF
jgi:hypothetical protein